MEYVQERIATLHDLSGHVPDAPRGDAAVVVPMTARERGRPAAEHTLETLAAVDPAQVVVPVRSPPEQVDAVRSWLATFDVPTRLLWCNGPAVERLLARHGLAVAPASDGSDATDSVTDGVDPATDAADPATVGADPATDATDLATDGTDAATDVAPHGKGTDVWLGLGVAADAAPYVVVHDADATTYDAGHVPRLLAPLTGEFAFTKGYYARVEDDGLYGRLFRLFYAPLVATLADRHDAPIVEYLDAFRYALAGEFGCTADFARSIRAQRAWGLEVGTLGEAFRYGGRTGTAQVDLGVHRHDHRSVGGDGGLAAMSRQVGAALLRVLADHGLEPEPDALAVAYRRRAESLIEQYAADARHNGLPYSRERERDQVAAYADAVAPPGADARLPAWREAPIAPADVVAASERALAAAPSASR